MLLWVWIRYRLTLRGLIKKKRSVQKTINKRYRQSIVKEMSAEERGEMFHDIDRKRVPIEEDITGAIVSYLFELAYHYRVPTPNFAELEPWETSIYTGRRQLTAKALAEFRKTIRDEQKERWQFWELRAKMMTAFVTGLTRCGWRADRPHRHLGEMRSGISK
jgi:hypothetical protein